MSRLGFTLALFSHSAFAATLSGTFSLLSYNVAGLPELLSSGNPDVDTPLISPLLAPFNVINVQEDFNSHAALYANDTHPFRTPTSGGAGIGSGLNTLSDFPYLDLNRVTWDQCDIDSGDCLTPKGFTYVRIQVSDGMWFDLYNLHADAGDEDGDQVARQEDYEQLAAYIPQWSAGMPIVVMGDTNGRYTGSMDGVSLRNFAATTGTTDAWVKNILGGVPPTLGADPLVCAFPFPAGTTQAEMVACEVVDKIFVRSGTAVTLQTTAYRNEDDSFMDSSGGVLSDHYPIGATAAWSLSSALRMGNPSGGPHGTPFNDLFGVLSTSAVPKITSFTLRSGDRIDAVQYTLLYPNGTTTAISHGGTGGSPQTLTFTGTEHITGISMCDAEFDGDTRVFWLSLTTSAGRTLTGGVSTSDCITNSLPTDAAAGGKNWGLVGFWGRSGDETDRLAPVWGAAY